jgi:hypothetical protein
LIEQEWAKGAASVRIADDVCVDFDRMCLRWTPETCCHGMAKREIRRLPQGSQPSPMPSTVSQEDDTLIGWEAKLPQSVTLPLRLLDLRGSVQFDTTCLKSVLSYFSALTVLRLEGIRLVPLVLEAIFVHCTHLEVSNYLRNLLSDFVK